MRMPKWDRSGNDDDHIYLRKSLRKNINRGNDEDHDNEENEYQ